MALRIEVARCLPKRDDPRRSHGICHSLNRILKSPASFVLGSLRGSTYQMRFSEAGSIRGSSPFAKIHVQG